MRCALGKSVEDTHADLLKTPGGISDVPAGRPSCPGYLSNEARTVFRELCRELKNRKVLTRGDKQLLVLYAELHEQRTACLQKIREQGLIVDVTVTDNNGNARTVERPNQHVKIADSSAAKMFAILKELGLTPNQRQKAARTNELSKQKKFAPGTVGAMLQEEGLIA
jgi:P27 family predicted phage terminase small subunit